MQCPTCGSDKIRNKGFSSDGSKRYKCKACNTPFTSKAINEASVRASVIDSMDGRSGVFNEIELSNTGNILVFGCVHLPFEHPRYLEFLSNMYKYYNCSTVICVGDIVDSHAISMHDKSPDGMGASHEIEAVAKKIKEWSRVFPNMYITYGNHDKLPFRQAYTNGLPKALIKDLNTIYGMPDTWKWCDRVIADGVVYQHGTGRAGQNAAKQWMEANRRSTVIAHIHSALGVSYSASPYDRFFAMSVGCGIDIKQYAFEYNKDFSVRPLIGCSVVLDGGRQPIPIPMYFGGK